jgi:hypothetical protein
VLWAQYLLGETEKVYPKPVPRLSYKLSGAREDGFNRMKINVSKITWLAEKHWPSISNM